jgi:cytochrome P450
MTLAIAVAPTAGMKDWMNMTDALAATALSPLDDPQALVAAVDAYLAEPANRAHPREMLTALHRRAPLIKATGTWYVSGYDAVTELLRDKRVSRWEAAKGELSIEKVEDPQFARALNSFIEMMINRDEPDHTRLRKLIRHLFLPAAVAGWQNIIERVGDEIIDKVASKREFDLVKEVGFPLPEYVICELLGVPHEDHDLWSQWSHDAVSANRTPAPTGENLRKVQQAYVNFHHYFEALIAERRKNPGDDMISLLILAEEDGDRLSIDEMIGTLVMLIQAGQETTANLVGNGMYMLMKNPERYRELVDNPGLVTKAVVELLRLDSPAQFALPRVALEDIEHGGQTIAEGDHIMLSTFAASFDPAVFDNPYDIDFHRDNLHKSPSFSVGIHSCIGRQFALLEANVMFRKIMERLPNLELVEEPERAESFTRGWKALIVRNRDVA